ncbi:uncharacterized protein V1518DRAFT_423525 [Limtongia smithiae]|uniref:uncharacterized protein n=1 Tax=Limtongia smithiae TaxID=1125753 RepID=UPI0034CD66D8
MTEVHPDHPAEATVVKRSLSPVGDGENDTTKRPRIDGDVREDSRDRGVAKIKAEFLLPRTATPYIDPRDAPKLPTTYDGEASGEDDDESSGKQQKKKKNRGQNKNRKFGNVHDTVRFCDSLNTVPPSECKFGANCKFEHDVGKYVASKPPDIEGACPVYTAIGYCPSGLKCRWLRSHFDVEKLVVVQDDEKRAVERGVEMNRISRAAQTLLQRKKYPTPKADVMLKYLDSLRDETAIQAGSIAADDTADARASYVEPPLLPSEKTRLHYSRAKILSPLTTVGNLPFRRLCHAFGADVSFSEMALALPLLGGSKSEWALPRTHTGYDTPSFGVQIAASKPWQAVKAAEVLAAECEKLTEINLNCGCPIDLIYRAGAGSALLDSQAKLARMLKGMNAVSGSVPVTAKIRMGTKDGHPTAQKLVQRLVREGDVASITLHGRSRQQRYTRLADWSYIGETAVLARETWDAMHADDGTAGSVGKDVRGAVRPWFIGNGDCYSWYDWHDAVNNHNVDSVMVARGALIKPWIFEEIDAEQYLDKSSRERLDMVRDYARFGLEYWGSDEFGINVTRRFLCEFLSFTCRYVPVGILEVLPPRIQDRPPLWKGRDELETLLGSGDYKDWVKISEMFLGPAHESFTFLPKHKSNAYEGDT